MEQDMVAGNGAAWACNPGGSIGSLVGKRVS